MTGVLDPQGPVAAAERLILFNAAGIMLVVVVPVIMMAFAFAWWYRESNARAVRHPDFSYSGRVELVVWAIPAMIVILLAGVAWIGSHALDPKAPLAGAGKPLSIQVVALDWKWLFIYPDAGIAVVDDLAVPLGSSVDLSITSATVMNAFFVPQLGSMIYAMPGMTTHLNLRADRAGDYPGLSSHFSGGGFSDMQFTVHALPPARFAAWLATARSRRASLGPAALRSLSRPDARPPPQTYGSVDAGLFAAIVRDSAPDRSQPDAPHPAREERP